MPAAYCVNVLLSFRKLTAAKVLAVKSVFFGQLAGTLVAVFLFEIGNEIAHSVFLTEPYADAVKPFGIFVWAYGKGRGKKVVFSLGGKLCGLRKAQIVAFCASRAPLGKLLKPL